MAAKNRTHYKCQSCGWTSPKWVGQCRECGQWGSVEEATDVLDKRPSSAPRSAAVPVTQVRIDEAGAFPSGISEFDRVLGAGITPGAVILLAGEPGVGKSTLLLDIAARYARMSATAPDPARRGPVLYASGEESAAQIRIRAERIGALTDNLLLASETDLEAVFAHITASNPALVILDSVQTVTTSAVEGSAGGVSQVKGVTSAIIQVAKERNIPTILVGHVTKEGSLAGPRTLEHLVDVVCQFEGDRHTPLRLLRAVKNRYGATDEVGCFQLTDNGIEEVPDPSAIFTSPYSGDVPGSCTTVTLEGNRPMTVEIQALVAPGGGGNGRRTVAGVDGARVGMVLAVLQARLGLDLKESDVYVSTVGGARATAPSSDLAIALAVLSALCGTPVPDRLVAVGEVGLTGDVRGCSGISRRVQEAARLGYKRQVVPAAQEGAITTPSGVTILPVRTMLQAQDAALS